MWSAGGQTDQLQSVLCSSPAEWSLWASVPLSVEGDARELSEELNASVAKSLERARHRADQLWLPLSRFFFFFFSPWLQVKQVSAF